MSSVAVIGAGTNGLAAACVAARAGLEVTVYEANESIGGATRTQSLDGSEAIFDLGSAVHPMAMLSAALRDLNVHERVEFIVPELSYAHVMDRRTVLAWRNLATTVDRLPGADAAAYSRIMTPLVRRVYELGDTLLKPLLSVPRHPLTLAVFGASTLSAMGLLRLLPERYPQASALLAGCAAHVAGGSRGPVGTGAGLFLAAAAHGAGWPIPRGGSQAISDALARELAVHGGRIETSRRIEDLAELRQDVILLDTSAETAARLGRGRTRKGCAAGWPPRAVPREAAWCTSCCANPSHGGTRPWPTPAPCTWGRTPAGCWPPNGPAVPGPSSDPSCSWPSLPASLRAVPRAAGTCCGPTAMSRWARTRT